MSFNSLSFLFVFLPLALGGFALVSRRNDARSACWALFVASAVFYGGFGTLSILTLIASLAFNFMLARAIVRPTTSGRDVLFAAGLAFNILLLGGLKYTSTVLPIGVSFYTFTQIAYLVDAYLMGEGEHDPIRYASFVAGFASITAGPILRYERIRPQLDAPGFGRPTAERLARGLTLVAIGLFKKAVVAAILSEVADPVFAAAATTPNLPWWEAMAGSVAYSFQIYFDFSGYSDMAVGLAATFGLTLPWNFNSPYRARDIAEFWQRWHLSLSDWLKSFVFSPLTFTLARQTRRKTILGIATGTWAYSVGSLITMLVCGVWHGVGWTFVLWGGMHGLLLVGHQFFGIFKRRFAIRALPAWAQRVITFGIVTATWVVFRAPDLRVTSAIWRAMMGLNGGLLPIQLAGVAQRVGLRALHGPIGTFVFSQQSALRGKVTPTVLVATLLFAAGLVWATPNANEWMSGSPDRPRTWVPSWTPSRSWSLVMAVITAVAVMYLNQLTDFIYFRF